MNKKIGLFTLIIFIISVGFLSRKAASLRESKDGAKLTFPIQMINVQKQEFEFRENPRLIESDKNNQMEELAQFEDLKVRFFSEIPKIFRLNQLSDDEIHGTPTIVRESAELMAEIREFFIGHPHLKKQEFGFYVDCVNNRDILDSVRALCGAHAGATFELLTGKKMSPSIFPKKIAELMDRVGPL